MKGAFLEADHSHVPDHIRTCRQLGAEVEIKAVSGRGLMTERAADAFGVPIYADYRTLLDQEELDFVYILGTHRQCPEIIREVVDRNIPFIVEKPCAVASGDLLPLLSDIRRQQLVHVVAMWRRYSPIVERYRGKLLEAAKEGRLHLTFRYMTGGPDRYHALDSGWLLDPAEAGGGFLLLDGCHYIDLIRYVTDDEIASVRGCIHKTFWDTAVEDYAALIMQTSRGSTATIEVGLTKPGGASEFLSMCGRDFYLTGEPGAGIRYVDADHMEESDFPAGDLYERNLTNLLSSIQGLEKPDVTLEDAYQFLKVIESGYRDAQSKQERRNETDSSPLFNSNVERNNST